MCQKHNYLDNTRTRNNCICCTSMSHLTAAFIPVVHQFYVRYSIQVFILNIQEVLIAL